MSTNTDSKEPMSNMINQYNAKLEEILLSKQQLSVKMFTFHSINIQDMYREAVEELKTEVPESDRQIVSEADSTGELLETFVHLQTNLIKYTFEMKRIFSLHLFMSEQGLQKFQSRACLSVSSEEDHDNSLLTWTLNQYGKVYEKINLEIIQSEQDIIERTAIPIALEWYQKEMQAINLNSQSEKHELLKKACKEGIKTCLSYSDNHAEILKSSFEELDAKLDQLYKKLGRSKNSQKIAISRTISQPINARVAENEVEPNLRKISVEISLAGIKCGTMENGQLNIIRNGENELFPLWVEFHSENEILINGETKNSFKTHYNIIHPDKETLGEIRKMELKTPEGEIQVEGSLLLGLALEKVKRQAELFLEHPVEHISIAVPLRYTSTKRQSVKDAAEIAGFKKVSLVVETTAAALAYFESHQTNANDILLVVVDAEPHYDTAIYKMENNVIQMITCTGDCHNHKEKRKHESMEKHIVRKLRKIAITSMIYIGKEHKIADSIRQQLSCSSLTHIKDGLLMGAALFSQKRSEKKTVIDLFPYKLKVEDTITKTKVFKISRRSKCDKRYNGKKFKTSSESFVMTEKGISEFPTGQFQFTLSEEDILVCILNEEGIFSVLRNDQLIRNTRNSMQSKQKEICSAFIKKKLKKEELRTLAEYLVKTSANTSKAFIRDEILEEAKASLQVLKANDTSNDDLDSKIMFLKELKLRFTS